MKERQGIRELMRVTGYESKGLDYLLSCMDQALLNGKSTPSNEEDDVYSDVRISHY